MITLPPHFVGSNRNASRARFWHKDSAISMYLLDQNVTLSEFLLTSSNDRLTYAYSQVPQEE